MKAAHRPLLPTRAQLVRHREIAGDRAWQSQAAGGDASPRAAVGQQTRWTDAGPRPGRRPGQAAASEGTASHTSDTSSLRSSRSARRQRTQRAKAARRCARIQHLERCHGDARLAWARKVAASASDISRKVSPGCQVPSAATIAPASRSRDVGGGARAEQQRLVAESVRLRQRQRGVDAVRRARETGTSRQPPGRSTCPADGASARRAPRTRRAAPVLARTTAGRAARRRRTSAAGVAPGRLRASRPLSAPET